MMTWPAWNSELLLVLHQLVLDFPWLYEGVAFATRPIWPPYAAALDTLVVAGGFLGLFLYYDDQPGLWRISRRTWLQAGVILLTGTTSWLMAGALKAMFAQPRPYVVLDVIEPMFRLGVWDSFPSGHAMFFSALSVAMYHYHRNLGALFVLVTVLIGVARVMAGVHFPIDILAGFGFGGGGAWLVQWWFGRRRSS